MPSHFVLVMDVFNSECFYDEQNICNDVTINVRLPPSLEALLNTVIIVSRFGSVKSMITVDVQLACTKCYFLFCMFVM